MNIAIALNIVDAAIGVFQNIVNTVRDYKRQRKMHTVLTVVEIAHTIVTKGLPVLDQAITSIVNIVEVLRDFFRRE